MNFSSGRLTNYVSCATEYLLYFLIILIPFSVRYVFESPIAYQTGAYSDFTSLSIYISDFVVLAIIGLASLSWLLHMKQSPSLSITFLPKPLLYSLFGSIAWIILELIIQSSDFFSLQLYFSARFTILILLSLSISQIHVSREKLAWVFTAMGAIQALVASIQFYTQKSIGLYWIGESHLGPDILGVAKIVAHGTKIIRGYGTFPHANLLAAFLVSTTLLNLYLLAKSNQKPRGILLSILLIINIFGLFITLSRGGLIAFTVSLVCLVASNLIAKNMSILKKVALPIIFSVAISCAILWPYLTTRSTVSDNAVKERLFYSEIGERIIQVQPIIGVGPGTSVLHMKQYANTRLQPWEIQPIHNYWLILWSEWGIGAILILIALIYTISSLFKRNISIWQQFLIAIGIGFLTLFMIDHYFYTIWPTQVLFWVIIGLLIREISDNATYDTAS